MNTFFRGALKVILVFFVLFIVGMAAMINWREIKFQYAKLFWEPELPFHGISPGMSRSEVYFSKGRPNRCTKNEQACIWTDKYDAQATLVIFFNENEEVKVMKKNKRPYGYSPPFSAVEDMKDVLGEENILAISKDFLVRRYTYLKWGITFEFHENNLTAVAMGEVRWRIPTDGVSQYIVNGNTICPSNNCPFDDQGNPKEEYKSKSYRDFM